MKRSGFKMKNPSIAKLAKAAGSPMKQNKPTYKEAFESMEIKTDEGGTWRRNKRNKFLYRDDEGGYDAFVNDAKLYNAKQKNKNLVKIERKKPKQTEMKMTPLAEPKTKTKKKFKDTRLGKFLTTKRVKGAKKKTYNTRLNSFVVKK